MAYTVKQLAVMSGVTVRTLHFYDEMGLLKPAYTKANGYRIYEEPQLLMLQQILFYRELGFELKRINQILRQKKFEKIAALKSHRRVLDKNVTRTRTLIETDKTIRHLKGTKKMKSEELFNGFSIGAGKDRFNDGFNRYGTTIDCKVSGKDTGGAMCVLEVSNTGWPRHVNRDQDEWIYVVDGEVALEIGRKRFHLGTHESMFIPRNIEHTWAALSGAAKIINTYQPAGKIEEFFQVLAKFKDLPTREQAIEKSYTAEQIDGLKRVFEAHGMIVTGPPLDVNSNGN
jgi:DNA-binding transcriptional MerR regulator